MSKMKKCKVCSKEIASSAAASDVYKRQVLNLVLDVGQKIKKQYIKDHGL